MKKWTACFNYESLIHLHTDNIGSTVLVTNEQGKTVWSSEYTPFGSLTSDDPNLNKAIKFTGKDLDLDIGLYYFNARWYDQDIGRFISEDPAKDGLNWYTYVLSNPLRYLDSNGLKPIPIDDYIPSEQLMLFLQSYEDLKLEMYDANPAATKEGKDPDLTIGWGHKLFGEEINYYAGRTITKEEADEIFEKDLDKMLNVTFRKFFRKYQIELKQNQYDALASFTFNMGPGQWGRDPYHPNPIEAFDLARVIIEGDYNPELMTEIFGQYHGGGGQKLLGLWRRRMDEAEIFLYGDYERAYPPEPENW